jgi:hypothetical protein
VHNPNKVKLVIPDQDHAGCSATGYPAAACLSCQRLAQRDRPEPAITVPDTVRPQAEPTVIQATPGTP